MARRVDDLQRQRADGELVAVRHGDRRLGFGGLFAELRDLLAEVRLVFGNLDVLRRFALPVAEELLFVRVQGDFGAGGLADLVGAAGVVEVVVSEHDVLQPHARMVFQKAQPRLDRLLIAEAAVDECAFVAVADEEDVRRLRAGVEGLLGDGNGVDVVGDLHG